MNAGVGEQPPGAASLRAALRAQGRAYLRVSGGSMLPTLAPGDLVSVGPVRRLAPGKIVTLETEAGVLTHRVVRVRGDTVVCRGDNQWRSDPPRPIGSVIGRVRVTAEGRMLRSGRAALLGVRARFFVKRAAELAPVLVAQGRLLTWQLTGSTDRVPVVLSGEGWAAADGADEEPPKPLAPASLDVGPPLRLRSPLEGRTVVPAGVYSRLPVAARHDLAAQLAGPVAEVWALPLAAARRPITVFAALRGTAAKRGVHIGLPGDGLIPAGQCRGWCFAHFFTAPELGEELRVAGHEGVHVDVVYAESEPLLRATIGRRAAHPR